MEFATRRAREARTDGTAGPGPVRTVLFDFDDTLFDHTRALISALRELRASERRLAEEPLPRIVRTYEGLLEEIQPGRPGGPRTHAEAREARFRRLDRWLGGSGDAARAHSWSERYRAAYQASRYPVEGAVPLLRRLKRQVSIGVVTNNHTEEQQEKIRALRLAPWIDFMVTSEDVGVSKPEPAIFEIALEKAGTRASEAVMVGDNWISDVIGATRAGIPAVWLQRRGRRPGGLPEVAVLRSFAPVGTAHRTVLRRPRREPRGGGGRGSAARFMTPERSG